jgi:23S rRNA (guanosine2251-2'-O)-methyltransferase
MSGKRPARGAASGRPPKRGAPRDAGGFAAKGGDVLYGRNPVHEALRAGRRRVHEVLATARAAGEFEGARVVDAEQLTELAGTDAHQGVVARVDPYPYADADELLRLDDPLIVALDEVQDPQNLGAVTRTAEAAGVAGLVLPERRSAAVTAATAKASAGAVEHLRIAQVRNLADFLDDAKRAGFWAYGADESAKTTYKQADWQGGLVLVLGAEGRGIRPRVRAHCDLLVSLPLHGRIGSLNVSAAAAVLLYEAVSRRGVDKTR